MNQKGDFDTRNLTVKKTNDMCIFEIFQIDGNGFT